MLYKILDFFHVFIIGFLVSGLILIFVMSVMIDDMNNPNKISDTVVLSASKNKELMDKTYYKLIDIFNLKEKYKFYDLNNNISSNNPIYIKLNLDWIKLFNPSFSSIRKRGIKIIFKKIYTSKELMRNKITLEMIDKIKVYSGNDAYVFYINHHDNKAYNLSLTWRDEVEFQIK